MLGMVGIIPPSIHHQSKSALVYEPAAVAYPTIQGYTALNSFNKNVKFFVISSEVAGLP